MAAEQNRLLWKISLPLLLAAAGAALFLAMRPKSSPKDNQLDEDEDNGTVTVKVIQARNKPNFVLTVQQLATVEPFFEAEMRSQVAGAVKFVEKNINDPVTKGELLVELDVPHLAEEVTQKEAIILQRLQEVKQARSVARSVRAFLEVARSNIDVKQAEVEYAEATRDFREIRWHRFKKLMEGKSPAVDPLAVEEQERDYKAAAANVKASLVAVQKAVAEYEEKESNLETAETDIQLKEALVEVARKDRDRVQAQANYARIVAPFSGTIGWRRISVGTFVPTSSGGQSEPILSVVRTDVVTVVTKIPDNVAPYVNEDTEVHIQLDSVKGVVFHGQATRVAPVIDRRDATKRVEIDLYNESREQYVSYLTECVTTYLTPLGGGDLLGTAALTAGSRSLWSHNVKGVGDAFPLFPRKGTQTLRHQRLIPGMSGFARLLLRNFKNPLIPSSAVFGQGGKSYILEVRDGKTVQVPVHVELNDGNLALVAKIRQTGGQESHEPLTGEEKIVLNQQLEVGDGQSVRETLEEW